MLIGPVYNVVNAFSRIKMKGTGYSDNFTALTIRPLSAATFKYFGLLLTTAGQSNSFDQIKPVKNSRSKLWTSFRVPSTWAVPQKLTHSK